MKTLLLLITLFSFLQSAFLPVNLVLVLIIARSLLVEDRENLFLAFFGGLILSFLTQVNLGYYPLVFILIVKFAGLFKGLPVSFNSLMVFLSGALFIAITATLDSIFIGQPVKVIPHLIEAVLVLPAYFLIRFWEGRVISRVTSDKLRSDKLKLR